MPRTASAPGKIILSGEYAVVFGFPGIAVPSSLKLTASYKVANQDLAIEWDEKNLDSTWITFTKKIVTLLEEKTKKKFRGTLRIENELPLRKGMGSSTALVIAVVRTLATEASVRELTLRELALELENEVNPGHSGLDFAVIWEHAPILFQRGKPPEKVKLPANILEGSTLIDSGTPNETTPELVAWVKSKYPAAVTSSPLPAAGTSRPGARAGKEKTEEAIISIAHCTERLLSGEPLRDVIRDHHRAQVALGVVPPAAQKIIDEIEAKGGFAKVLGAGGRTGGGGMILAFTPSSYS